MLRLVVDTCVWLDVARDIRGEALIAATRTLVHEGELELLVPQVVIDEYDRNREQVVSRLGTSTRAHLRFARAALAEHGRGDRTQELLEELDQVAVRGPLVEEFVVNRFGEVRDLLSGGTAIEASDADYRAVVQRGLDKRAPFHSKASVADALLVEMYGSAMKASPPADGQDYGFVTHNTTDFSSTDRRLSHPDLASLFEDERSGYFTSLQDAYSTAYPERFEELFEDLNFVEEVRSGREILAAEKRLYDLIWYQRSIAAQAIDSLAHGLGGQARARIEAAYSPEELAPYDAFEWGMLNGKLSTLRWVMGDDWDFLDT